MTILSSEQIQFEPGSVVDPVGKVFRMEDRVFRAIAEGYGESVRQTVDLAHRHDWFSAGLVRTSLTEYSTSGSSMILEHERVPFNTVRGEWAGEGLRAAAICIMELQSKLLRSGFCLKDAHPWNVLFDGPSPRFIDWGSIRPAAELNIEFWYGQFRQYLLAPLYAFAVGEHRIARAMLREHRVGVGNEIMGRPEFAGLPDQPRLMLEATDNPLDSRLFDSFGHYIEEMTLPQVHGEWATYEQPSFTSDPSLSSLREKDRIVHGLLAADAGETLIDIGTNNGLHSEIAAVLGKRVLACDIEESCLNSLYLRVRDRGADILPLYHDFLWPIGTSGILNSIPAAEDRLRCDTLLMMAVTHHLAFKHHVSFEAMARGIDRLARRKAIVEFVPPTDVHVAQWDPGSLPWYCLDNFLSAMTVYFDRYTIVPSEPVPRCVVVFER